MLFGLRCSVGLGIVLAAGAAVHAQTSFQVLDVLLGSPGAQAHGVSANGQFIAGHMIDPDTGAIQAVVWNAAGQPMILPPYGSINVARGVSDTGTVVPGDYDAIGIVWGGGFGGNDALLGPGAVFDVTPDGLITVGVMQIGANDGVGFLRLFIGVPILLPPDDPDTSSTASGVTADGAHVAGASLHFGPPPNPTFFSRACVWTGQTPAYLDQFPGAIVSQANAISADGTIVVGFGAEGGELAPTTAVRWVNGVPTALTPGEFGNALDVSADGQVVVGEGFGGAFVWDAAHGVRQVRQVLIDAGINMDGFILTAARSVSADGTVIAGWGLDSDFVEIAWKAVISRGGDCPPDFNGDGTLNSQDFFDFLAAFFASDPAADYNGDTVVNSQDFFDFLADFFTGC